MGVRSNAAGYGHRSKHWINRLQFTSDGKNGALAGDIPDGAFDTPPITEDVFTPDLMHTANSNFSAIDVSPGVEVSAQSSVLCIFLSPARFPLSNYSLSATPCFFLFLF